MSKLEKALKKFNETLTEDSLKELLKILDLENPTLEQYCEILERL